MHSGLLRDLGLHLEDVHECRSVCNLALERSWRNLQFAIFGVKSMERHVRMDGRKQAVHERKELDGHTKGSNMSDVVRGSVLF